MRQFPFIFLLLLSVQAIAQQQQYIGFTHELYDAYERAILDNRAKHTLHTAVKPYLAGRKMIQDTSSISPKNFWERLMQSHWVEVDTGIFHMTIDPIIDVGGGRDTGANQSISAFGRGAHVSINAGDKLNIVSGLVVNQYRLPGYYTNFYETTGFDGGGRSIPGIGLSKRLSDGGFDFLYSYGHVSYTFSKYFNVQFGHGHNFIGDGYRSLLLSDFSPFYPYVKLTSKIWKFEYTNLFAEFTNLSNIPGGVLGRGVDKKMGSFHYLSTSIGKRLQIGVFEGVIWQRATSQGYYRGVDINYLNPVIFYRPVEFSLGSPDNAILGLNVRYDLPKIGYIYGQMVLDDVNFSKISEFGDLGHINNKFGWQIGAKLLDIAGIEGLNWRNELNIVRPYTYAHRMSEQSYTHSAKPLAHPLGANFREFVSIASYRKGRFSAFATWMNAHYGEDTQDFYYGRGLFENALEDDPRVNTNDNELLQGDLKKLSYIELKSRYCINQVNNLAIELSFTSRNIQGDDAPFNNTNIISISLTNVPFNMYRSF